MKLSYHVICKNRNYFADLVIRTARLACLRQAQRQELLESPAVLPLALPLCLPLLFSRQRPWLQRELVQALAQAQGLQELAEH